MTIITTNQAGDWPEISALFAEMEALEKGQTRSGILICGAMLDHVVLRLLRRFLTESAATEKLVGNDPMAPLGTFAARCWAAEAMGLVTEQEGKCLKIVRDLRNEYAHRMGEHINEESARTRVTTLIRNLPYGMGQGIRADETIEKQFRSAVILLSAALTYKLREIDRMRCRQLGDLRFREGGTEAEAP